MAVWKSQENGSAERAEKIELATYQAAAVPIKVARLSLEVAQIANRITSLGNVNAVTDAAAAAILAQSAVQIAAMNVKINAIGLEDREQAARWLEELDNLGEEVHQLAEDSLSTASSRGGF